MKTFVINFFSGVNTVDSKQKLRKEEATDCLNIRLKQGGFSKRPGISVVGSGLTAAQFVVGLKSIKGVLLASQATEVKKLSGSSWVASGLSGLSPGAGFKYFVPFPAVTIASATVTGTTTSILDNFYGVVDSSKTFTENQYVNYYLKMTSGTASGEIRIITANTDTEIFVSEPFTKNPVAGDTYSIFAKVDGIYFFDGDDQPKKNVDALASTTWTNISNIQFDSNYFAFAVPYKNRLVGVLPNSTYIWVSALLTGEDYPYKIPVGDNGSVVTSVAVVGNQLVVHKGMSGGVWISEFDDPTQARFIQRSENFAATNNLATAIGENIMFFTSDRGIEWFNPLETDMLEGQKSLSDHRLNVLRITDTTYLKSTVRGLTFDAKYFYAAFPSVGSASRVFIFDTALYLQSRQSGSTNPQLPFVIDGGYSIQSIEVHNGEIYVGGTANVYKFNGLTDNGSAITAYWQKDGMDLGAPGRNKQLRDIIVTTSGGTSGDSIVLTVETERESKTLDTFTLANSTNRINARRCEGKRFLLDIDITGCSQSVLIESIELYFEIGTV